MTETNFKHTDLGLIPHDWEVKTIGSIADVKTGPFGSALHASDYVAKGTPIITVEHIGEASILHTKEIPQVGESDTIRLKAYTLKEGDLVFSRVGSVDRCGYIAKEEEGWLFSGRLLRVRPIEDISSKYLTYHLNSKPARDRVLSVAVGLAMPSINTKILEGVSVALPPTIAEQERIAGALSSIDTLIGALTEQIEKKRHIKQGTMQQLLTGKERLAGFKGEWKTCKIKDIFRVTRGYVLNSSLVSNFKNSSTPYPVYSSQTADKGVMGYYDSFLYENAITWTTDGANAGDVNFRKGKFYCTNVCGVLLSEEGYANECVAGILSMCSKSYVSYVGNPKLMNNVMAEIEITIPPTIAEQSAIAAVLSNMDTEIAALEQKRDKYIAIKSGMMQNLLTGKIRLV